MELAKTIWAGPSELIRELVPEHPVLLMCPVLIEAQAKRFLKGFQGLVSYAVKANPDETVLESLIAAGITAFDVASKVEIAALRRLAPRAALHYHNPIRSREEIAYAVGQGVRVWSVDCLSELEKLAELARGGEVSVRFALAEAGGAYNFGTKFGASEPMAAALMQRAEALGFAVSLTFHVGTQCADPEAWARYIQAAGRIARAAGVRVHRLNVGGGFPAYREAKAPDLEPIFARIAAQAQAEFADQAGGAPALVCEPGRALVADSHALVSGIKALRDRGEGAQIFLNDGIYGGLAEATLMGAPARVAVYAPDGTRRAGALRPYEVFGPTCDSVDRLPAALPLPEDLAEGDYLVFQSAGAYSTVIATRFNGFGALETATAMALED